MNAWQDILQCPGLPQAAPNLRPEPPICSQLCTAANIEPLPPALPGSSGIKPKTRASASSDGRCQCLLSGRVCSALLAGAQPSVGAVAAAEVSGEESEHRARSAPNIVSYACLQAIYTAPIDSLQPVIISVDFFFLHAVFVFTLRKRNNISQC